METVRFIHAADLHLDAAFYGLTDGFPLALARNLHDTTFVALERFFTLCEQERPDFVVLAGDIYNQEDRSVKAQLALRKGCARLERLGIAVFIVHGNHDPYTSRLVHVHWPANVTVFGEDVTQYPVYRQERLMAMIHGASHASSKETRNLAAQMQRTADNVLQIGLLHTTLGDADGTNRYAPCSLDDLVASKLDYWALGHVHEHRILCKTPLAVYPGALQGMHINETGNKGCVLVTATRKSDHSPWTFDTVFHSLAPLRWETLDISLEHVSTDTSSATTPESLDEIELVIRAALDAFVAKLSVHTDYVVARVRLFGRTALDGLLRKEQTIDDLIDTLRESPINGPTLLIKDIQVHTRPHLQWDALQARDDFLGEVVRSGSLSEPEAVHALVHTALAPLYNHARARKVLLPLSPEEEAELLESALLLCADILESE